MKLDRFVLFVSVFCGVALGDVWSEPELIGVETSAYLAVDNQGVCWCGGGPWIYRYHGDSSGWQPETQTPWGGEPYFDRGDTLWLFANEIDANICYTRYDGTSWSAKEYVPVYSCCNLGNKVTIDSSGVVWVAWSTEWWGFFKGAYNRYQNGVWQEPQPVTDTLEEADHAFNSITTDAYGRVWFGWSQSQGGKMVFETKYYDNGNWSEVSSIAESEWLVCLKLTPDRNGGVWALWNQQDSVLHTDYLIKTSYWNGDVWMSPETVAVAGAFYNDDFPCGKIAVDAYGNAWAVWRQALEDNDKYGDIYYSVNTGSGWSEPAPVNENPAVDQYPDIAVDGEGRIWCVWSSNREGEDEWDYSIWASYATGVGMEEPPVTHQPPSTTIESIYPNPFRSSTTISYSVSGKLGSNGTQSVKLSIFDVSGREVKMLESGEKTSGHYEVIWNGNDAKGAKCPSGVYFIRMYSNEFNANQRVILLK